MKHKITSSNIYNFLQGNSQMILDNMGLIPRYHQEQIAYRMLQCKDDCMVQGKCKNCGCKVPGRLYTNKTCGDRFPDIMNEKDWIEFKKEKGIE